MARTGRDDHSCIGVPTLNTLVEHDILGVVLSRITENKVNGVTEIMVAKIDEIGSQ